MQEAIERSLPEYSSSLRSSLRRKRTPSLTCRKRRLVPHKQAPSNHSRPLLNLMNSPFCVRRGSRCPLALKTNDHNVFPPELSHFRVHHRVAFGSSYLSSSNLLPVIQQPPSRGRKPPPRRHSQQSAPPPLVALPNPDALRSMPGRSPV